MTLHKDIIVIRTARRNTLMNKLHLFLQHHSNVKEQNFFHTMKDQNIQKKKCNDVLWHNKHHILYIIINETTNVQFVFTIIYVWIHDTWKKYIVRQQVSLNCKLLKKRFLPFFLSFLLLLWTLQQEGNPQGSSLR